MTLVSADDLIQEIFSQEGVIIKIPYPKESYQSYKESFPKRLKDEAPASLLVVRIANIVEMGTWSLIRPDGTVVKNRRVYMSTLRISLGNTKTKRPIVKGETIK